MSELPRSPGPDRAATGPGRRTNRPCDGCDSTGVETLSVRVHGEEAPRWLCASCRRYMRELGLIGQPQDHGADFREKYDRYRRR